MQRENGLGSFKTYSTFSVSGNERGSKGTTNGDGACLGNGFLRINDRHPHLRRYSRARFSWSVCLKNDGIENWRYVLWDRDFYEKSMKAK